MLYLFYLAVCFLVCCCLWNFSFHLQRYTKYLRIPNFNIFFFFIFGCTTGFEPAYTSATNLRLNHSATYTMFKTRCCNIRNGLTIFDIRLNRSRFRYHSLLLVASYCHSKPSFMKTESINFR